VSGAEAMRRSPQGEADADRRRQVRRTCLLLGLIVAGVFAAWLAGEGVRSYLLSSRRDPEPTALRPAPTTLPVRATSGPASMVGSPLAEVGLEPMAGHPGGFVPPPGARRLFAFRRRLTDATEEQGRYELAAPADAAAEHSRRALGSMGFKVLSDTIDTQGRRTLVFRKAPAWATVSLWRNRRREKSVIMVVTVVTPPSGTRGTR